MPSLLSSAIVASVGVAVFFISEGTPSPLDEVTVSGEPGLGDTHFAPSLGSALAAFTPFEEDNIDVPLQAVVAGSYGPPVNANSVLVRNSASFKSTVDFTGSN